MPIGLEALLLLSAFICAVFSLAGKVPAAVSVLLRCVLELVRLVGR